MSRAISQRLPGIVVVSCITLLAGCDRNSIKQSLSSSPVTTHSHKRVAADNFDSYYGMPDANASIGAQAPKVKRIVHRTKGVLKGKAPVKYKVKKGDTLWGIANKFLKDPWFWPEIWDKNQRITNPHLIYPGDTLFIYRGPRQTRSPDKVTVSHKMVPQIRIERGDGYGQPISTLAPFLAWPRLLDKATIERAPYIVKGRDANLLLEPGKDVYIKNLRGQAGQQYAIYSPGRAMHDPETGALLGYEAKYGGKLQAERIGNTISVGSLLEMNRSVRAGHRLYKVADHQNVLNAPILPPSRKVRGSVISLFDAHAISGQGMIVAINRGKRHGFKPGYVVGVYRPGLKADDPYAAHVDGFVRPETQLQLPPERVASAVVYEVLNDISYALVTKSMDAISNGYKIGNP